MTALDEITAAIDRLTALRDASTPGPWEFREESPSMNGRNWTMRTKGVAGIQISAHEYRHGTENTELIVTLHETIDPLLAIMSLAVEYGELAEGSGSRFTTHALALARAINQNGEQA